MNWGWIAKLGGYAAAPFTGGASILAGNALASLDKPDQPKGSGNGSNNGQPEDPYTAVLGRSAQESTADARSLGNAGAGTLEPVLNYFRQLTSQNPSAIMDATRPERARVIDQYDTARKAISTFGPRGGGSVSANAQSQFDQAESLADVTSSARRSAMSGASALGVSLQGLSLSAKQLASADLNTLISTVLARERLKLEKRGQNMELAGGIGNTLGTLAGIWLGKDDDSGGGGTTFGLPPSHQPPGVTGGTLT